MKLDEEIKVVFELSKCRYGSPRVYDEFNKRRTQTRVSVAIIARRMQALKLVARSRAKFVHTTDSEHGKKVSPNLLNRKFDVKKVNAVLVSDITYIPTDKGWHCLTVILDLAYRAVVRWTK